MAVDLIPDVEGRHGRLIEATPAVLVDTTGAPYKGATGIAREPGLAMVNLTFTATTSILAANELIADTQVITNAFAEVNRAAFLESLTLIDFDSPTQAPPCTVVFLDANVSLGTENNAPTITDGNAVNIQGKVTLVAGDWTNLTNNEVAMVGNLHRLLKPIAGTRDLAVALLNGSGTPTFGGGAPLLRLGFFYE